MKLFCDWSKVQIHEEDQVFAMIYFGKDKFCKTEADAREAAELLKKHFEAKKRGFTTCLLIDNPKGPVFDTIDQMNARRERKAAFKIAKLAALIFAHNSHNITERQAVQSAGKILKYAQEGIE